MACNKCNKASRKISKAVSSSKVSTKNIRDNIAKRLSSSNNNKNKQ